MNETEQGQALIDTPLRAVNSKIFTHDVRRTLRSTETQGPVVITKFEEPRYVIMSVADYEKLTG